jgi:hypothetical protein
LLRRWSLELVTPAEGLCDSQRTMALRASGRAFCSHGAQRAEFVHLTSRGNRGVCNNECTS